jgi:outer membrane protein OmpA-like peptidoglycan-associated protein
MRPRYLLTTLLITSTVWVSAQQIPDSVNMVINGGFEETTGKLKRMGNIAQAVGWSSPTTKPADLFSEDVAGAPISVPQNNYGDQSALNGGNYAGLIWWSYMNRTPRTYLQTKFKKPLKRGQKYCVRYYVSLADLSKYASSELGAYISKLPVNKPDDGNLTYNAQIPTLRTKIYDDYDSWQGVCGVIEGTGQESYLILGNFAATENTNTSKIRRPRGETRAQQTLTYYYIDDVAVFPIKSLAECTCEQVDKAESEFIYGRKGMTNKTLPPSQQIDNTVIYFKRFQRGIDGSMGQYVDDLAELLKRETSIRIRLVGHSDAIEADRVRMRPDLTDLAKDRAERLKAALVEAGVPADRITTGTSNADAPADDGDTEVALAKNRRVEVELVK